MGQVVGLGDQRWNIGAISVTGGPGVALWGNWYDWETRCVISGRTGGRGVTGVGQRDQEWD